MINDNKVMVLLSVCIADKEENISLYGSTFIFGRSVKSDVCINDPCISRSHFQFFIKVDELWIADMCPSNGTYVNGVKLEANAEAVMHAGDILTIENSDTKIIVKQIKFNGTQVTRLKIPVESELEINEREDITSIINKIIEDAQAKAEQIIDSANKIANEAGGLAKEKAIAEFTEKMKSNIIRSLETDKEEKKREIMILQNEEKGKIQNKCELELKVIQDEHVKYKSELQRSLVELEDDITKKRDELSTLDLSIENKKQKNLKDLDREYSESMKIFKESREKQDAEVAKIKNKISKLEKLHESKKSDQLKFIEVEVENRKNELQIEIGEYEAKLVASKKEFSKLYDTYELKKTEQVDALNGHVLVRDNVVLEIKKLESIFAELKISWDFQVEQQRQFASESNAEVSRIKLSIQESQKNRDELAAEQKTIEQVIANLKQESANEKKIIFDEKDEIQLLNLEISDKKEQVKILSLEIEKSTKNAGGLTSQLDSLNEQVKKLKNKIDASSVQAKNADDDHKQKLIDLERNHLEAKKNYQDEMIKLKESEEKRLQQQLHEEMSLVSKLKEESLRLVIDLEDSIAKEISLATSNIFVTSIGASKYSEIAPQFEKAIRLSLQSGVLKLLKNDLDPTSKSAGLSSSKKNWKPMALGMSLSAMIFGLLPYIYKEVQFQTDPAQQQLRVHTAQTKGPVLKFTPTKVKTLGSTFVNSVNYTESFCEIYALEEFRTKLVKEGSVYLYKNWRIEEEKSIESYAIIFSMIDALKLRRESVNPEFEKRDIDKMVVLENETMKKIEKLLGNGVRVEAALKFQARFYSAFVSHRDLAVGSKE